MHKKGHEIGGITHKNNNRLTNNLCSYIWSWDWKDEVKFREIIEEFNPDYFINFATYHHSSTGDRMNLDIHKEMLDVNLTSLAIMLRAVITYCPETAFIHASSSQIFSPIKPAHLVNESSIKIPSTFYGYTKLCGMQLIDYYRREYKINAGSAILFNHESIYRSPEFVTRRISKSIAEIKLTTSKELKLRNIGAMADMSSAYDVVEGILLMCEKGQGKDYIFASSQGVSILDLVKHGFEYVNMDWEKYTKYDEKTINNYVVGDTELSEKVLGWKPIREISEVMESMIDYDLKLLGYTN